jgi:hypothetical protein
MPSLTREEGFMNATAAAEAANFYPVEPTAQPHLRLIVNNDVLIENPLGAEDELAQGRSDRFKGQVAIEGLQAEYDAITELAELTDGQMRSELELTFDGYDLYGPDGRSLTETAKNGLKTAREQAKKNGNLWFEVGRRSLELEEVLVAVDMLKDGKANTMMLTTDFPVALEGAKEDIGGYNVTRKQALRRAIMANPDSGVILLISQTLDGSNPQALDAVDAEFDFQTAPGEERLGQRQLLQLSAEEQATIMDRSVQAYDRAMSAQFGGEWYAGRRPADYRNTYDFVRKQHDLIDTYKHLKLKGNLTDEVMYDMAATINARFKESKNNEQAVVRRISILRNTVSRPDYDPATLYQEMRMRGRLARLAGKSFSACGSTWKAEGLDESTEEKLRSAGYGNTAETGSSWHGGRVHKNAKCVSCNKVKNEVGACHICEDCVKHPKSNLRTLQGRTGDPKKAKTNEKSAQIISFEDGRRALEAKRAKTREKSL